MIKKCLICKKEFYVRPSWHKKGMGKYCSKKCSDKSPIRISNLKKSLKQSYKNGRISFNQGKHLSKETKKKISSAHIGKKPSLEHRNKISKRTKGYLNPNWKGGRIINKRGYVLLYKPNHPFSNNHGQIKEHRLVMEKHLGRYLKPEERIHHINCNPSDNRIKNLMLFKNIGYHCKFHRELNKSRDIG